MALTLGETETHLNMVADDRSKWEVFTDDVVMQRKFERIGAVLVRETANGSGKFYTLRANQVSFRKGEKREMSEERRLQAAANMQKMRSERQKQRADKISETTNSV